ncbi:MAG: Nuclear actin-protein involved in chromatin remodeling [Chaenotheca gracillima]|nr:MAG: Nuclear actin-protein involved in chromatin remodeling [Chaenotheca gracillima]
MQPALAPAPHPMQNSHQDNATEHRLRQQLLGQVAQVDAPHTPLSSHSMDPMRPSSSASPNDHNIDPAISGGITGSMSNESGGEDNPDGSGKKGSKRELSTSKRAAQNRAAQRAFRQRKEGYIKKLEEQVHHLHALEENYKAIQAENYQLRDYIINLQSRLIESGREAPPLPSNIDLHNPQAPEMPTHLHHQHQHHQQQSGTGQHQVPAPTAPMGAAQPPPPMGPSAVSQLQASAQQAVADLNSSSKHHHEEAAYLQGGNNGYPPPKRMRTDRAGHAGASGAEGSRGAA